MALNTKALGFALAMRTAMVAGMGMFRRSSNRLRLRSRRRLRKRTILTLAPAHPAGEPWGCSGGSFAAPIWGPPGGPKNPTQKRERTVQRALEGLVLMLGRCTYSRGPETVPLGAILETVSGATNTIFLQILAAVLGKKSASFLAPVLGPPGGPSFGTA